MIIAILRYGSVLMATCPICNTRQGVEVIRTDRTVLVALPVGTYSLAGNSVKASMVELPVVVIAHPECGLTVECYDKGDGYAYQITHPPAEGEAITHERPWWDRT
jgi:hypothetical protein